MLNSRTVEFMVGIFILLGVLALLMLSLRVSGLSLGGDKHAYTLSASFENIGGLKVRAPVAIAGVKIGQITAITLNPQSYQATVTLKINSDQKIPSDSSASILTQGLLGANYISISPGYEEDYLKDKAAIQETHSALILENLVGQLIFSMTSKDSGEDTTAKTATNPIADITDNKAEAKTSTTDAVPATQEGA